MPENQERKHVTERLFAEAFGLHVAGRLDEAAGKYHRVLTLDTGHAASLHYLGVLQHQRGEHALAIDNLQAAAGKEPDNADWHNDFGNVLFALGRFDEARVAYEVALVCRVDDAQTWNNYGAVLRALGRSIEAMRACEAALELLPDFAPAMLQLAALFDEAGDRMQSSRYECMAYVLPPHEGKSREMLGVSYYFLGRMAEAADVCRRWLEEEPSNPTAAHMYAAYAGKLTLMASADYVEQRFDDYADHFDQNLVERLGYRGPQAIANMLESLVGTGTKQWDILDVGCGTGLCAPVLAPYARRLEGIDLSGNMLLRASAYPAYDHLSKAEAIHWMSTHAGEYDLIVASDMVIYFGELDALCDAARLALRAGGHFIFTVEAADEEEVGAAGYMLHPSGRFRHCAAYVEHCLRDAGFCAVAFYSESIRLELGAPVPGLVVTGGV